MIVYLAHIIWSFTIISIGFVLGSIYYKNFFIKKIQPEVYKLKSDVKIKIDQLNNDILYVNKLYKLNKELNEDLQEAIKYYYSIEH